jgi:hypothetical protein
MLFNAKNHYEINGLSLVLSKAPNYLKGLAGGRFSG